MASEGRLFQESVPGGARIEGRFRAYAEDQGGVLELAFLIEAAGVDDQAPVEILVAGKFNNPIGLSVLTSALLGFGWCLAPKVIGIGSELVLEAYRRTAKGGWMSNGERADAMGRYVREHAGECGSKVGAATVECLLPFKRKD